MNPLRCLLTRVDRRAESCRALDNNERGSALLRRRPSPEAAEAAHSRHRSSAES